MREGFYVGHHSRSGAMLLLTSEGVVRGNGLRRLPEDQRWDKEGVTKLTGLPWEVKARNTGERAIISEAPLLLEGKPTSISPPQQRNRYVTKADIERFGATEGCPGCTCVLVGGSAQIAHNPTCRNRIGDLLAQSEEGKRRLEEDRRRRRETKQETKEVEEERPEKQSKVPASVSQPVQTRRKRKADVEAEKVQEETHEPTTQSASSSSGSTTNQGTKRPAEESVQEIDPRTKPQIVDVEDLVSQNQPQVQSETTEQDAPMNSLELAFENLSSAKNEMSDLVQDFVRQCNHQRTETDHSAMSKNDSC